MENFLSIIKTISVVCFLYSIFVFLMPKGSGGRTGKGIMGVIVLAVILNVITGNKLDISGVLPENTQFGTDTGYSEKLSEAVRESAVRVAVAEVSRLLNENGVEFTDVSVDTEYSEQDRTVNIIRVRVCVVNVSDIARTTEIIESELLLTAEVTVRDEPG